MRFLLLGLLAFAPCAAAQVVPDTTAPWRYYPLHIGDAWEYYEYGSSDILRREINRDSMFNGRHYFVIERYRAQAGGPLEPDFFAVAPARFDTTEALVKFLFLTGEEGVSSLAPCPFDADFGTVVKCPNGSPEAFVNGGYDGLLVFGGDLPGTGEDTVRTAWKEYLSPSGEPVVLRYAADFGEVYFEGENDVYGLYYARVNGVEHGVPRYPTPTEPSPEPLGEALTVWPNPAREWVRVAFTPKRGGTARVEVHDVRGRQVLAREVAAVPGARAEVALDLSGLAPGVYVVRLAGQGGGAPVRLAVLGR
jgi:hypothetical protein